MPKNLTIIFDGLGINVEYPFLVVDLNDQAVLDKAKTLGDANRYLDELSDDREIERIVTAYPDRIVSGVKAIRDARPGMSIPEAKQLYEETRTRLFGSPTADRERF